MPTVLSTKKLSLSQKQLLLNAGIGFVEYDAIKIEFLNFDQQELLSRNYIFTSKNAVQSVLKTVDPLKLRNGKFFCVGFKTKELLESSGFSVEGWASYGAELGELIVSEYSTLQFTYFCGNIRREELPDILKKKEVTFTEIPVYVTTLNKQVFNREFDGVLFYSPSGVQSFFSANEIKNSTAFCIGNTTASAAEKFTDSIKVATKPSIENLIVQVVKKFK